MVLLLLDFAIEFVSPLKEQSAPDMRIQGQTLSTHVTNDSEK